jgi:hypothetical protein
VPERQNFAHRFDWNGVEWIIAFSRPDGLTFELSLDQFLRLYDEVTAGLDLPEREPLQRPPVPQPLRLSPAEASGPE